MDTHPAAALFPLLEGAALDALAADIQAHGLRVPIVIHPDGTLLDGRNRLRACEAVGVTPARETWTGELGHEVDYVISLNLARRHLDESQRAMVAARLATLPDGGAIYAKSGAPIGAPSQPEAAARLNVSRRSVQRARLVLAQGIPALIAAVDQGTLPVSESSTLAKLPVDAQAAVLAQVQAGVKVRQMAHVGHNTGAMDWFTPVKYVEPARRVLGAIDLDPASTQQANEVIKATKFYTHQDNGLLHQWRGRVWMNPPYAQPLISQFCEHLVKEVQAGDVTAAVVLVNNATETAWFRGVADISRAVCFPDGRVCFWHPSKETSTPLQGQALLYIGPDLEMFRQEFTPLGTVWVKS